MLGVPAYTYAHRPYSTTLYSTSFTPNSLLAPTICAQRKTNDWCFTPGPMVCVGFFVRLYALGRERRKNNWTTGGPIGGHRNYYNSIEHKSRGLEKFLPKMVGVPAYTYEYRPYSATLYPTSFTLDSLLALRICAQRKTYGLCFTQGPMACGGFFV